MVIFSGYIVETKNTFISKIIFRFTSLVNFVLYNKKILVTVRVQIKKIFVRLLRPADNMEQAPKSYKE